MPDPLGPESPLDKRMEDLIPHPDGARPAAPDPAAGELQALRRLLLKPEMEQIEAVRTRQEDPRERAQDVGEVLAEAVVASTKRGDALGKALAPTLETSIRSSIRNDARGFADLLLPVIGPAIRSSIALALRELLNSLNEALEHSLTLRGLKWRLEAVRTGRPFSEVVLSHTLLYRVEQVFLIHGETGLVLQHAAAPGVEAQDPGMVSGMLTAIQDFVRDSFGAAEEGALETMEVGGVQVWVEHGPEAAVAAAVRGNAPAGLRRQFREIVEEVHLTCGEELNRFEGDAAPFERVRPLLESALLSQREAPKRRSSPAAFVAGGILLAAALGGLVLWKRGHDRSRLAAALEAEPGYVVTSVERSGGKIIVRGLRDGLSREPGLVAREAGRDPGDIRWRLQEYLSLEDRFVLERATRILDPPASVKMTCARGVLRAAGLAPAAWREDAANRARLIPGVRDFAGEGVRTPEEVAFYEARRGIESSVLAFAGTTSRIAPGQEGLMDRLAREVKAAHRASAAAGKPFAVELSGHTDPSGPERYNEVLARRRALAVRAELVSRGVPSGLIAVVGVSASKERPEPAAGDPQALRRVSLRVVQGAQTTP